MATVLRGAKELQAALARAGAAVQKEALVRAVLAEAEIIAADARSGAPKRTNKMAQSIKPVVMRRGKSFVAVAIGPSRRYFYGLFQELGTKPRELRGKGKYRKGTARGFIQAHHFLARAFDRNQARVLKGLGDNFWRRILAAART